MADPGSSFASDSLYTVDINPEKALEFANNGATLLLLDVPPNTSIGIDQNMLVVGPIFKGIKMIPPGTHFFYYSAVNKEGNEASPITGFFLNLKSTQVIVRRWNPSEECLVSLEDKEEEERFVLAVKRLELDSFLGPFNLPAYSVWHKLSDLITAEVIERLEPIGGSISVMNEAGTLDEQNPKTGAERRLFEQLRQSREKWDPQPSTSDKPSSSEPEPSASAGGRRCYYTKLPRLVKGSRDVQGSDLTALNLDKSKALEQTVREKYNDSEDMLLGEMQFCFAAFLFGQSLESFSQWKSFLHLMCGSFHAPLHTRTQLFTKWLEVVYHQLKFGLSQPATSGSSNLFQDSLLDAAWLAEDNFLQSLFTDWFSALREAPQIDSQLLKHATRLRKFLEASLGWDLIRDPLVFADSTEDEYAPVVVSMEESWSL